MHEVVALWDAWIVRMYPHARQILVFVEQESSRKALVVRMKRAKSKKYWFLYVFLTREPSLKFCGGGRGKVQGRVGEGSRGGHVS